MTILTFLGVTADLWSIEHLSITFLGFWQNILLLWEDDDLLTGSRESNLYTLFLSWRLFFSVLNVQSHINKIMVMITYVQLVSKEKARKLPAKIGSKHRIPTRITSYEFVWANEGRRYNKTPYELIRGRKLNIQYFHMFGSFCHLTNDPDDLGKMKPTADIGIFIGYSESLRIFHIYNRRTKKIMEMIHVKFDELIAMASEYYYATSTPEVSDNSAANTLDNEDTPSSSSIVVKEDEALQIVSSSAEPVAIELNTPVLNENSDELFQEDVVELDRNIFYNPLHTPIFEEVESSSTYQDP
ncbi:retrovirus-related pol polyprotein from transposon TNT 1-94 [Tanacetum coccineum]|uniref:Retrovirus-related pol polyprotein from transposon TNT 1-94 n=1 Tax=Tanacetum coccineum TaxID=301880 RepID=A0ABQ5FKY9_9ASTR